MNLRKKTYFITDAHLGSGDDADLRERDLVNFLRIIEPSAERVVLLGDIFDFWFTYKYVVPRGYVRFLGRLAEMADKGIELHFFIGNHDMWLFDYLCSQMKITMHNDPLLMNLHGWTALIGHGDGLGNSNPHYNRLKRIFRSRFNQRLFSIINPTIGIGIATIWSNHSRNKHNIEELQYLGDDREDIVQYCKRQLSNGPIDCCMFGHRHGAVVKHLAIDSPSRKTIYINVGNWIDQRNFAALDDEGIYVGTYTPSSNQSQPLNIEKVATLNEIHS